MRVSTLVKPSPYTENNKYGNALPVRRGVALMLTAARFRLRPIARRNQRSSKVLFVMCDTHVYETVADRAVLYSGKRPLS